MGFVVAIDGPAGSGKGTVTKIVAERKNLISIDTGAMYRCVALDCINNGISPENIKGIEEILEKIKIDLKKENGNQKVYLNGKDVSEEIRSTKVNNLVSEYSAVKEIRDKITPTQQKMGIDQDIIMEGRDIGTVVFPNADLKIFLDCDVKERARRRFIQNQEKGIISTYEEILENIIKREKINSTREIAPFVKADDAILIDSTNLSIEQVVEKIIELIEKKGF